MDKGTDCLGGKKHHDSGDTTQAKKGRVIRERHVYSETQSETKKLNTLMPTLLFHLLLFKGAPALLFLLTSLVLSISLFSISSIVNSTKTGPNSSRSHQSLQTPTNAFAPPFWFTFTLGCAVPFSHLACSTGCVAAKRSRSSASRLCFKSSSVMAHVMAGMASPVRPSSVQ